MKNYVTLLMVFWGCSLQSQISGNQVYGNNSYETSKNYTKGSTTQINENQLNVSVKILLNNKADYFTLVLGTNEEATTVQDCHATLNKRIDSFTKDLAQMNIKKEAIYVDFISQTKIYDYDISGNNATEFLKGFEVKKNIIITSKNLTEIENIITKASKYSIYDIIKVDYANNDAMKIHLDLFEEAMKIAHEKKEQYIHALKKKLVGTPNAQEEFSIFFPKTQYKKYQAYESADVETYYRNRSQSQNFIQKIARKNTTFYYDGVPLSGFDKIIDVAKSEIGIQYVLNLTVTYKIDTSL
ncbi:SIMPL domain-containing protein [Flavobacterium sp. J27]|uniref:SIMPL domain-containing protein n=1 Tax=Flavobacterium sp. J27 TaxID=2060419 RepID=UPI00103005E0|nr:SIMPL domain-containing protein [Flavobacterium sp. J27]